MAFAILIGVKLKRVPEDFQVEELAESLVIGGGEFALYRLAKRGLGTIEAVDAVARRWKLSRDQITYGGLKDRHAQTIQHITIRRGPRRDLTQTNLKLEYLGQHDRPFTSGDVTANRFRIVLRSLADTDVATAKKTLELVARDGLPNYFDDQRFGSIGESNEFVTAAWIAGDYERAVWLALADANPLDRPDDRLIKRQLRERWGNWRSLIGPDRSPVQQVVRYLSDRPRDFRGALTRIPQSLRSLCIAAFQSYLWNRLLAALVFQICPDQELRPITLKIGDVPFFTDLSDAHRQQLHAIDLPLPSARIKLADGPIKDLVTQSLAEIGLSLREIRIKYPRDSFFSKGWRPATFQVRNLSHDAAADELYPAYQKLLLCFDLPRGCYATILVKRLTLTEGTTVQWESHEPEMD